MDASEISYKSGHVFKLTRLAGGLHQLGFSADVPSDAVHSLLV